MYLRDDVINERTVGFWAGLQNYIHDYLESVTLQDVIDGTYAKLDTNMIIGMALFKRHIIIYYIPFIVSIISEYKEC